MTASERFSAAAAEAGRRRTGREAPGADGERESGPVTIPATSSSALLDARFWLELSPWRISAAWSLAAAALAAGAGEVVRTVSPQTLALLFLLVDPLWGNIWGGLATPEALPRIRIMMQHRRPWLPYLAMGSPAARVLGMHGPGVLSVAARAWLPGVVVAIAVSFAIGMAAVWATLVVLGLAVSGWLSRHVPLAPASVLHSVAAVAAPWILGLTLFGLDPWDGHHWALVLLWTMHVWGANRSIEDAGARSGLTIMAVAQAGITLILIVGRAPLALAVLGVLWLATWVAVYRGRSLVNVQASWTAAMLVSAAAMAQGTL